jgi:hypothetical protein
MRHDEHPDLGPEAWYARQRSVLEHAYLASDDPHEQSGFAGDPARWRRARRPIVEAIHRDGSLLDVGCANGLLMESLAEWAAEEGWRIEPYGLDISEALVRLARRRYPRWADRLQVGNATDWRPPRRFDFVRTELVYAPPRLRPALVERLASTFVVPGGRLIVCSYGSAKRAKPKAEAVGDVLRGWGHEVVGETEGADSNGVVFVRVAWMDTPSV